MCVKSNLKAPSYSVNGDLVNVYSCYSCPLCAVKQFTGVNKIVPSKKQLQHGLDYFEKLVGISDSDSFFNASFEALSTSSQRACEQVASRLNILLKKTNIFPC